MRIAPIVLLSPSYSARDEATMFRTLSRISRMPLIGPPLWALAMKGMPSAFKKQMPEARRDKKQFADFVRIHAINGNLITREDEMKVLKEGITRYRMELDEATGTREIPVLVGDGGEILRGEEEILPWLERFEERPDARVHRAKARAEVPEFDEIVSAVP